MSPCPIWRWLLPLSLLYAGCKDPGTDEALALKRGEVLEAGMAYDWRDPGAIKGRGLRNMRLRAERIGATWSISVAEGCTVRLELPH